ncbi:MAG: outer membrane protein assembly factor BamB [Verrucomicrobiales bacterium]|jgi:outer membrane protein assembly factor BamB
MEICTRLICLTVLAWSGVSALSAQDWPQFRGPNQDGTSNAKNTPVHWSETENVAWKTELPGRGWSSPVIGDGKIWLTTAIEQAPTEAERQQLLAGISAKKQEQRQVAARIQLAALCIDLESGALERTIQLAEVSGPDSIHTLNSYASPTPTLADGLLFCDFGTFATVALDVTTGNVRWTRKLPIVHNVGPGSSPIVVGNLLILVRDGVDMQYVTALDTKSGETVWKTPRPPMRAANGAQKKAYSTPLLIEHDGREQLVIPTSQWIVSYEPSTGKELWRADHGSGFSLVPRAVHENGVIYACTGFGKPQLWAVRVDGSGDVTESHVLWKETKRIPAKPSPLVANGRVYVVEDGGVASCFDGLTGKEIWSDRLGGNYSASPILVADKIYIPSQEGKVAIFDAGDQFRLVAENQIDGEIMASLAPIDGGLILRSKTALYRISTP